MKKITKVSAQTNKINKIIEAAPIMNIGKVSSDTSSLFQRDHTTVRTRRTPKEVAILLEKVSKLLAKGKTQKFISEKLNLTVSYTQYLASKVVKVESVSTPASVTNEMLMEAIGSLFGKIKKGFQNKLQVQVNEELVCIEKTIPKKFFGITYSTTTSEFVIKTTFTYGKEEVGIYNDITDILKLKIWLSSSSCSKKLVNKVVDYYQRKLSEQNKKEKEILKKKIEDDNIPNFDFSK